MAEPMKLVTACLVVFASSVPFSCASDNAGSGDPSNGGKNDTASDPGARIVGAWERKGTTGPYLRMVFMDRDPRVVGLRHEDHWFRYIADRDPTTVPFQGQPMEYFCSGKDCAPQREDAGYTVSGSKLSLAWDLESESCTGCVTGYDLELTVTDDELTLRFEGNEVERLVRVPNTCSAPDDCAAQIIQCTDNNNCEEFELMPGTNMTEKRWTCNAEHRCEFTNGKLCKSHSECAADEYCQEIKQFDVCGEEGGGSCVRRPTTCPTEVEMDRRSCGCETKGGGELMSECEVMAAGDNPVDCFVGGD